MGSIIEFVLRTVLAALALVAEFVKTTFRKWSGVDRLSAIVCCVMFAISLLTWNSWLLLCWIGAAACLSIAASQGWQWSLLDDLQILNRHGVSQMLKGSSLHVDVVGEPVNITSSTAKRQTADVDRTTSLLKSHLIGQDQAIEAVAHGNARASRVVGRMIEEIKLPRGAAINAIVRGDEVLMAHHDTVIAAEDHVILFVADRRQIEEVERLFEVGGGPHA